MRLVMHNKIDQRQTDDACLNDKECASEFRFLSNLSKFLSIDNDIFCYVPRTNPTTKTTIPTQLKREIKIKYK